jgi:hypothetical protein
MSRNIRGSLNIATEIAGNQSHITA